MASLMTRFNNALKAFGNTPYDVTRPNRKRQRVRVPAKHEDRLISSGDRQQLRLESRNQYRNNPLARAIVDRITTAAVGNYGLIPQSEAPKPWGAQMESAFYEWGKIADYRQRSDLVELQRMTVAHLLLDGEAFFIQLKNGQIQPVEAERIFTPKQFEQDPMVYDGVRVNEAGIILGYYVAERNEAGFADMDKHQFVQAKDMIHVRKQSRFDSIRGVPELAPALEKLIDLHETENALLMKVKGEAKRGFAIKSDSPDVGPGNLGDRLSGGLSGDGDEPRTQYEAMLDGQVYYLNEGESIDPLAQVSPNSTWTPYCEQLITDICSCMGVSSEWVLNKFSTSYIASRASMLTTTTTIEAYQLTLEIQLMQRLWNWSVYKFQQAGLIDTPPRDANGNPTWFKVNWIYNRLPSLDEEAESKADSASWRNATTSLNKLAKKHGYDFVSLMDERIAEAKYIVEKAKEHNVPVWMLFPPQSGLPITYEEPKGQEAKDDK